MEARANTAHLVQLKADKTGNKRRRSRNGGDDLARNLLGRVPVSRRDAVVQRTEVGRRSDEVDVVVRIIVLLELDRVQAVPNQ